MKTKAGQKPKLQPCVDCGRLCREISTRDEHAPDCPHWPKEPERFNFRVVEVKGAKYIRLEDVAEYLRSLGATEETDVRNRMNEAAANLVRGQP